MTMHGAGSGADDRVLRVGRAVHEVPLPERALLALDDQQRLAGDDEEVLLISFPVVHRHRLARLEDLHVDPELGEVLLAFQIAECAAPFDVVPARVACIEPRTRKPSPLATSPCSVFSSGASVTMRGSLPLRGSVLLMSELVQELDALAAEISFSPGMVRIDRGDEVVVEKAYGFGDRRWEIPNRPDTRFAIASGLKGMTALAVVSLVEDGKLELTTTARSLLGDVFLIGDDITVEHLLAHRSGIGDYLDEDAGGAITDYVMPIPVHQLAAAEEYVAILDGFPAKFAPGERFAYCNGGFVVLAVLAERASGVAYHELVAERVCEPAGMYDTSCLRSDELPGNTAMGYLAADGLRTNVLHLPVRGVGDGGIYTTAADVRAAGRRSSGTDRLAGMGRGDDPIEERRTRELAVRPRLLAAALDEHRQYRGIRRGCLVPFPAQSRPRPHVHRHLQLE